MMETLYGCFQSEHLDDYKKKLHSKLYWLLLYKDPETKDQFNVDFDKYFVNLMKELTGLSEILLNPTELLEMMSKLQAAYNETLKHPFEYGIYRKFVLDAHSCIDRLPLDGGDES